MTVAVLGAGWLGAAVAAALPGDVMATNRSGTRSPALGADIELHALDLLRDDVRTHAIVRADTWVVAVAPGRDQGREAVYLEGARRMLAALPHAPSRRLVWIGSTSALPDLDAELDEDCTAWPEHERGRIQRQAEGLVAEACGRAGTPWFVLRMGGLYGPGRELARLYGGEATGPRAAARPSHGMNATNLVHRDDAVAAVLAAIAQPRERSGIVHVVDDDHCPRRTMIDHARREAGLPPAIWADADERVIGKRVRNDRLRSWLGVTLAHPRHGG
ncbi:MAG: NAD-dependent epimerase/dehydratase family protein [Deltaproteobacteria bacterium]|nr:NAD-dependent epimerase/dehydratase family protein [Deltaproteobacteria bacterium]